MFNIVLCFFLSQLSPHINHLLRSRSAGDFSLWQKVKQITWFTLAYQNCSLYFYLIANYISLIILSDTENVYSFLELKIMYTSLSPHGSLQLYQFIAMVTVVMIVLSQFPSFHSLRFINLGSLVLSLGYTFIVVGACIHAG